MKEVCGYIDVEGGFHKTETECKQADAKIKIRKLADFLDSFEREVSDVILKEGAPLVTYEEISRLKYIEERIYNRVSKIILSNSPKWQKLIREREELKVELDILKSNDKLNSWWLKIKWW